jgi:YVTN family beta-propeller protein
MALHESRLFVANTNSDSVSVIDIDQNAVGRTIAIDPFPGALLGSSPNAGDPRRAPGRQPRAGERRSPVSTRAAAVERCAAGWPGSNRLVSELAGRRSQDGTPAHRQWHSGH